MAEGNWGVFTLCERGTARMRPAPLSQLAPLLPCGPEL